MLLEHRYYCQCHATLTEVIIFIISFDICHLINECTEQLISTRDMSLLPASTVYKLIYFVIFLYRFDLFIDS